MTVEQTIESRNQALLSLIQCAWYLRNRDDLIRRAHHFGIGPTEIARILGMNRSHISEIANTKPGGPPALPRDERPAQQPKDDT